MAFEALFQHGEPYYYLSARPAATFADLFLALMREHPAAIVRVLRGSRSRTRAGFFGETAAALQFPYYFGENWHAFDECITSLWMAGDATVLLIADAHLLFADEAPQTLANFISVVNAANGPYDAGDGTPLYQPNPLKIIFQIGDGERTAFEARLTAAGGRAEEIRD